MSSASAIKCRPPLLSCLVHQRDTVNCECTKTFFTFPAYNSHIYIYRSHRESATEQSTINTNSCRTRTAAEQARFLLKLREVSQVAINEMIRLL